MTITITVCAMAFLPGQAQATTSIKDVGKVECGTKCTVCNGTGWNSYGTKCTPCNGTGATNEY